MKIETLSGQARDLKSTFQEMTLKERLKRSFKAMAIGLGLALCALPFPGVHLFLVPAFLGYAIYSGFKKYNQTKCLNISGEVCPSCGKPLKETVIYSNEDAVKLYCYECRSQLKIS